MAFDTKQEIKSSNSCSVMGKKREYYIPSREPSHTSAISYHCEGRRSQHVQCGVDYKVIVDLRYLDSTYHKKN